MLKNLLPIYIMFFSLSAFAGKPMTYLDFPALLKIKSISVHEADSKKLLMNVMFSVSHETVNKSGDTACLQVKAKGFQNIGAIDLFFQFDSTILKFVNIKSGGITVTNQDYSLYKYGSDLIFFSWYDLSGKSLPDDNVLFEMCFKTTGPNNSTSPVNIIRDTLLSQINIDDPNGTKIPISGFTNGSVKILTPVVFNVDVNADSTLCNGASNGRIRVRPTSSAGPFTYKWQNQINAAQTGTGNISALNVTDTIKNLPAGNYFVTVYNATKDSTVKSVEVKQPDKIFINLPKIANPCPGLSNGTITFTGNEVNGGTKPYTFEWSNGSKTTSITNLASGAYEVTVTDAKGCKESNRYTLGAVTIAITNSRVFPALCKEARNGQIEITAVTGGSVTSGNYLFKWSNSPTNSGPTSLNPNLGAGDYTVTIQDDNKCELVQKFTVPATRTLLITASITNVTCFGLSNGSILVNARSTGSENPPFDFKWSNNVNNPINTGGRNSLAANLRDGTYTLNVVDRDGCTLGKDTIFTVSQPTEIKANANIVKPGCTGDSIGQINLSPTGGVAPYTYRWSPLTTLTGNSATKLGAGTYLFTITDSRGCTDDSTVILIARPGPTLDRFEIKDATCFDKNSGEVSAFIVPATGTTIRSYAWSNGGIEFKIKDLFRGNYILTVTASDGCKLIDTAKVGSPPQLRFDTANISFVNPRCPADSNGNIVLAALGGTQPYRFFWSKGQPTSNPNFVGLKAGTYSFSVTDFNECPVIDTSFTLTGPPDINLTFLNKERTTCNGNCINGQSDGKVTVSANGGGGGGIFTYQWSSGETVNNATKLCGGWQRVSVSDNQCVKIDSVLIEQPQPYNVQARTVTEPTCFGDTDGKLEIVVQGSTRPYNFRFSNGITNNTGVLSNIPAGKYAITITDANNCEYQIKEYILEEPGRLKVDTIADKTTDVRCFGENNGQIYLQVTGGTGRKTFRWRNSTATGDSLINIPAGSYTVTVTDTKGCDTVFTHTITQPDPIFFSGLTVTPPVCHGGDAFITVEKAFGGTKVYPFFFSVDEGPLTQLGSDFLVLAGKHRVRITEQFTECSLDTSVTITQPPAIKIEFSGEKVQKTVDGYKATVGLGSTVRLSPTLTSSLPIDTAKTFWSPNTYLTLTGDILRPFSKPLDDISYKLVVTDLNGCRDSSTIDIELERDRNLYIPNIFSPNDDGDDRNNFFTVFSGPGVKKVNYLRVYDRWGELLYVRTNLPVSNEPSVGWDGKFNGKFVNQGVYVFISEVEFEDGAVLIYRGDVTVVR